MVLLIVVIESQVIYSGKGGQCSSRFRVAEPWQPSEGGS